MVLTRADEVEPEKRKKPWWLIILVIVAVLALAATAIAVFDPFGERGPELVTVPQVVGETDESASTILRDAGLKADAFMRLGWGAQESLPAEREPSGGIALQRPPSPPSFASLLSSVPLSRASSSSVGRDAIATCIV